MLLEATGDTDVQLLRCVVRLVNIHSTLRRLKAERDALPAMTKAKANSSGLKRIQGCNIETCTLL